MSRRSVNSPEENDSTWQEVRYEPSAPEGTGLKLWEATTRGDSMQVADLCQKWAGHGEVINWAHPDYNGSTPLHHVWAGPQITTILLGTPGIDVNKETNDGTTPLLMAAQLGEPETIQALLAAPGIDLNKASTGGPYIGKSPLTIAREKAVGESFRREDHQEIARLLEAAGAKATTPSKGGKIKTRKNKRSKKNKRRTSNLYRRRI